jgi:hypothetical protein
VQHAAMLGGPIRGARVNLPPAVAFSTTSDSATTTLIGPSRVNMSWLRSDTIIDQEYEVPAPEAVKIGLPKDKR